MNFYFISDDRWFLEGLQKIPLKLYGQVLFIHTNDFAKMPLPNAGDVVVINVADIALRQKFLHLPVMSACRVIILLNISIIIKCSLGREFPWLYPDNAKVENLISCLHLAAKTPIVYKDIRQQEKWYFQYLNSGESHKELAARMGLSEKSLYALKRRVMASYGLSKCHCTAVMVCRDITGMHQYTLSA
ncbi:hypothetical protein [Intestinirhabdus alba]|jgi:hypothetical protein|uniref:LuxR family transcriptional regulator n=1 Tax=Intestinirhabdus alba TaxID=2899544 RepID=A0A6L6IHX9_9ENTR|nr:hypothetical protein [Intestinirhabdus alba]MTH45715.1 hypothetical protein [Intestinirhabdus alba]